jgi:hypothetical protein
MARQGIARLMKKRENRGFPSFCFSTDDQLIDFLLFRRWGANARQRTLAAPVSQPYAGRCVTA